MKKQEKRTVTEMKIIKALLSLMTHDDFQLITITQIAQEAEISRKTFYRYFKDKDSVILRAASEVNVHMMTHLHSKAIKNFRDLLAAYFEFWDMNRDLFQHVRNSNVPFDFNELSMNFAQDLYFSIHKKVMDSHDKYKWAFFIGAMNNVLFIWLKTDKRNSANELMALLEVAIGNVDL